MERRGWAAWVRRHLAGILPGWLGPAIARAPNWTLAFVALVVVIVLVGTALNTFFTTGDIFERTVGVLSGDSIFKADPGTREGQEEIKRQLEATRAENAAMRAKIDAILAAVKPKEAEASLTPETEAAKEQAVVGLVTDPAPAAQEAARELAEGTPESIEAGFARLAEEARAAEAEAARKWRRLGALAAGVDTKRALAAYEEAFRLDPNDFWTAIELSRLHRQAGDLAESMQAAEAAERAATTERQQSVAFDEIGDVRVAQGNLEAALESYRASLAIAERLSADDPGNAGWRRDLSVSHNKIGDVRVAQGNLEAALESYRASHDIFERLSADDPGNAGWRRDVWVSLWRLAKFEDSGVTWADVVARMEAMRANGTLFPPDAPFLEQARALAAEQTARQ